jgi:hypothetical protein
MIGTVFVGVSLLWIPSQRGWPREKGFIFYFGHDAIDRLVKDRMHSVGISWLGETAKILCWYIDSSLFHISGFFWRSALRRHCSCSCSVSLLWIPSQRGWPREKGFIFYFGHDAIDRLVKDRMHSVGISWLGKTAKILCWYIDSSLFHISGFFWRSALRRHCSCSCSVIFHRNELFNPGHEISHTFSRDYVLVRIPGLNPA